jgi:hypothetical protein
MASRSWVASQPSASGGDNTALIAVADGLAVGWSGGAEAFHPVVLDLATEAFTDVPLEQGDDLGMLMVAADGWAVGWSCRRDGGDDTSIAWNLATGERRVIGMGLVRATGTGGNIALTGGDLRPAVDLGRDWSLELPDDLHWPIGLVAHMACWSEAQER